MKSPLPLVVALLFSTYCFGQSANPAEIEKALQSQFEGKTYILKGFPTESRIDFDANCDPVKKLHIGSWTTAGIEIEKVQRRGDSIAFVGRHIGFALDKELGKLVKTRMGGRKTMRLVFMLPFSKSANQLVEEMTNRVFVTDLKDLVSLAPDYWHAFLSGGIATGTKEKRTFYTLKEYGEPIEDDDSSTPLEPIGHLANGEPLFRVSKRKDVTAPIASYSPDPEYSEAARAANFQGITVLTVVVLSTGEIGKVQIVRPIGFGLDDVAAECVKKWKFQPASRSGKPVAVMVNIEVSFNLY